MDKKWIFHFRNFDPTETWFAVCHEGGDPFKSHDGREVCWDRKIPHNPTGGFNSVYNPSDWIWSFDSWWSAIRDALNEIADISIYISSEGFDEEALEAALKTAYKIGDAVLIAKLKEELASISQLQNSVTQSRAAAAQAAGLTEAQVQSYAAQIQLPPTGWVFVAGSPCIKLIHDDNDLNNHKGFSIMANPHNDLQHEVKNVLANHVFIYQGEMYFVWDSTQWHGNHRAGAPGMWYNY